MGGAEVVTLASVSKRYFRRPGIRSIAAELRGIDAPGGFWALRDVNLAIGQGERLGVVGANGAGKTTLLRLLSGVVSPTRGERHVRGRVLALSEMQACLHRELTGRENIPLLAALAGLSRREVEARLDEVLAFSGLPGGALDTPVKNYSEGMAARLAISIAVTGEADLIVVDEGIAGGDATFRRQCFDRLRERASRGCAVVLASHDARDVRTHCDRCLHLQQGRIVADGPPDEVLAEYRREQWSAGLSEPPGATSSPAPPLTVDLRLSVRDEGTPPAANRALEIELRYEARTAIEGIVFGVEIVAADGARVFLFQSPVGTDAWRLAPGPGAALLRIPNIGLAPGAYEANVDAWDRVAEPPPPPPARSGVRDLRRSRREIRSGTFAGARVDKTLDSKTAEPRATWPARALYRAATAVFVRGEWLDALVYRLLTLRHGTRQHEGGKPDTVHFFVGSLGFGGAQRQLVVLVRYLVGRGYRCRVWVQERQRFFEADIENAGATWECVFGSPDSPWVGPLLLQLWRRLQSRSHVWTALALAARLRSERPAVLQCFLDTTNVAGALAGRMAGVPVVVAGLRSLHPGERRTRVALRFQRRFHHLVRPPMVDAVIANSESGRASFLRQQPEIAPSGVRLVRNGLDPTPPSSETDAEIRGGLDLPPDIPLVLWAGRLAPEKRLDVFLRACATLAENGQQFVALVVGDGAERRTMQSLAADLGLSDRVRFLGMRRNMANIIRIAYVAVLTSEIEGLPNILLEAQLAGCPAVATRAGGASEVVEDEVTGFLVEIGDHAAVSAKVSRLLDDPALAADMGRAGAERSRRLFSVARMGEETLEVYRELAERRGFQIDAPGRRGDKVWMHGQ